MKRILSMSLVLCILLSAFSGYIVFSEEEQVMKYSEETEFIKKLDIISGSFNPKENISRGAFAAMLLKMLCIQTGTDNTEYAYSDVPVTHLYYNAILSCKQLGVVSSLSAKFRPDDIITPPEAITMLINILGYTQYATSIGQYPAGYIQAAKQYSMLDGINLTGIYEVNGDLAAKLIYNSLFLKIVKLDYITEDEGKLSIYGGSDYLYHIYKIYSLNAVVFDNGIVSLDGQTRCADGMVILKDVYTQEKTTVFTEDSQIYDFIGSRIKAYIKYDNGINSLFHYERKDDDIVTIDSSTIINVNNNYIEYEPEKDSGEFKKANYSIENTQVMYNGMKINVFNNDIMIPEDGYLELVDNDNDGCYDLISIVSFNFRGETDRYGYIIQNKPAWNIVADNIDYDKKYINCRSNPALNNLDLQESKAIYRFTKRSTVNDFSDIEVGNIVSVAMAPKKVDNKPVYLLTVSDTEITDRVLHKEGNSVVCDNGTYKLSTSVPGSVLSRIEYNQDITFYTDILGKIAYVDKTGGTTNNYGYLISAAVKNSIDDVLRVSVFTKEGKIEYYDVATKCIIDGQSVSSGTLQLSKLTIRPAGGSKMSYDNSLSRPVIYRLNREGLVNNIDTDNPNDSTNLKLSDSVYADQSIVNYSNEEIENRNALKAGYRAARNTKFKTRTRSFDGRFFINSDTVIISVPDIDTYGLEKVKNYYGTGSEGAYTNAPDPKCVKMCEQEKEIGNYNILSVAEISANYVYDAQAYDVDPETGVASLLVLRGRNNIYGQGSYSQIGSMYVFLRMTKYYDSTKEKSVYKIYYTKDGTVEESAIIDKDELFKPFALVVFGTSSGDGDNPYGISTPALKKGDIIRVEKTGDLVSYIDRVLIFDTKNNSNSLLPFPEARKNWYASATNNEYLTASLAFDMRKETTTNTLARELHIVKPKAVTPTSILAYMSAGKVNDINLSDHSTFNLNYYTLTGAKITVIETGTAGELFVREGNLTDIKINESLILLREYDYEIEQMFVFN